MPPTPSIEAVQVPLKYPTALIYVDESAVKASAGRFFVVGEQTNAGYFIGFCSVRGFSLQ